MTLPRYSPDIERAVREPTMRAWEGIRCWAGDCGGFGVIRDGDECRTCGGSGRVIRYTESRTFAKYPGGPLLGREAHPK